MPYVVLFGSAVNRDPPPKSIDILYHQCTKEDATKHAAIWATNNGMSGIPIRFHEGSKGRPYYPAWSQDQKGELLFADTGDNTAQALVLENLSSCIHKGVANKEVARIAQTASPRIKLVGLCDENSAITPESVDHIYFVRKAYQKDPALVDRALSAVPWGKIFRMIIAEPTAFEKALKKRGGDIGSIKAVKSPTSGRWMVEVEDETGDVSKIPLALFESEMGITNTTTNTAAPAKKESGIMAKLPSKEKMKAQAIAAAYRTAARKAIEMATNSVAIAMEKKLGDRAIPGLMAEFLKTDFGKAIFGMALSFAIEQLPIGEGSPQKERVVEEIRVMSMEMGFSELADFVITPLTGLYEGLFANLPKEEPASAGALAESGVQVRETTREVEREREPVERERIREVA